MRQGNSGFQFGSVRRAVAVVALGWIISTINTTGYGATRYTVLHRFAADSNTDSNQEMPHLVLTNNTLYGATRNGGADKKGTLYRLATDGTDFTLLHEFTGTPYDGSNPTGALALDKGFLYGLTTHGGKNKGGVIYRINSDGTGYKILHDFFGWVYDGDNPSAALTSASNALYGPTPHGGTNDVGVLFRINQDGTDFTLLHTFTGNRTDGGTPLGSLTHAGNILYGVTHTGGARNKGILFRLSLDGTDYKILHHFTDAANPIGTLVSRGNELFGLTAGGGNYDKGTIYRLSADGTGFTILHHFGQNQNDGSIPHSSLLLLGDTFLGTTSNGGRDAAGIIFQINTDGKEYNVLHHFNANIPADGAEPYGDLLLDGETLYGLTRTGGNGAGVLYRLNGVTP